MAELSLDTERFLAMKFAKPGIGAVLQVIWHIAFLSYGHIYHQDEKPGGETIARIHVLNHAEQDKSHVVHYLTQAALINWHDDSVLSIVVTTERPWFGDSFASFLSLQRTESVLQAGTTVPHGGAGIPPSILRTFAASNTYHACVNTSMTLAKPPFSATVIPSLVRGIHRQNPICSKRPTY
eukprot:scaffold1873_cov394-Pavlova_lutheri.AAC.3